MERDYLFRQMKEKAQAVQTIVAEVRDFSEAFGYAVRITKDQGGTSLAAPGPDLQNKALLEKMCEENGLKLLTENLRDHLTTIHTAFTLADWGIAETGTLVLDSTSEDMRIATMLAQIHVAVLPLYRIQPDSVSLETELSRLMQSPPRYLAFISGASRTADIERVLTIGVHGPQELHLLIREDKTQ